jgi:thiamine kinase-like enzyme
VIDGAVQAWLESLSDLQSRALTIEPLAGGLTNRNYRVDAGAATYVLRISDPATSQLGIDRSQELECATAAASAGVAPAVLASHSGLGALLREFVDGRVLTEEDTCQPGLLARISETLRRYHSQPVSAKHGRFCAFETVRNYRVTAAQKQVEFPPEIDRALALLENVQRALETDEPRCLCHNDLLAANFIDDGAELRLIDWEYAGAGDRFFDLGNLAVNLQLDDSQERALLTAYFGTLRLDDYRRLRLMRLASDMREAFWGFVQAGISKLHSTEYYLDYGRRHLLRFLEGAAHERL